MNCQISLWSTGGRVPICTGNASFFRETGRIVAGRCFLLLTVLAVFLLPRAAQASLVIYIEGTPGASTSTIRIESSNNTLSWGGSSAGEDDSEGDTSGFTRKQSTSTLLSVENWDTSGAPTGTTTYLRSYNINLDFETGSWMNGANGTTGNFTPFAASEDYILTLSQGSSTQAVLTTFDDAGTTPRNLTFTPGSSTIDLGIDDFNEGTWQWTAGGSETITLSISAVPEPSPLLTLIPLFGVIFLWRWFSVRRRAVAVSE